MLILFALAASGPPSEYTIYAGSRTVLVGCDGLTVPAAEGGKVLHVWGPYSDTNSVTRVESGQSPRLLMEMRADDRHGWLSNNTGAFHFEVGATESAVIPYRQADLARLWSGLTVYVTLRTKGHELIHEIVFPPGCRETGWD